MIVKQISNYQDIADYCKQIEPLLATPEQAYCAKNRMNIWFNYKPNYSKGIVDTTVGDSKLQKVVDYINPEADMFQIFYSTNMKGINTHKDWRYFEDEAYILNLGNGILTIGNKKYTLTGGELIKFNCHEPHSFKAIDNDRVGIGIWQLKSCVEKPFRF